MNMQKPYTQEIYKSRKEGERGDTSMEDCIDASAQRLKDYIKKNKGRLTTAVSNSIGNLRPDRKATKTRKKKQEEKQMNRDFK